MCNYYFNEGGFLCLDVACVEIFVYASNYFFVEQRMLSYDYKGCTRLTHRFGLALAQESTSETTKCTRL